MTPAELIISAVLTAAAVVPIAATLEKKPAPGVHAAPDSSLLLDRYAYKRDCTGGPCVVDQTTKEVMGF